MKFNIFFTFLLVGVVALMAAPTSIIQDEPKDEMPLDTIRSETERADRQRRVTCDLLSFKGIAEHSACAANCLSMGKAGGRCENGICICRMTTFKELWDKRFG